MSEMKVHAGDWMPGKAAFYGSYFALKTPRTTLSPSPFMAAMQAGTGVSERVPSADLESVEVATEEAVKRVGGTVGWGAAGAVLLGPVGLLAGLLLGGRKKEVTFVAQFKDGRRLLATTDGKTYTKIAAAGFQRGGGKT